MTTNSDEIIARMKARLVYQVTACNESSTLLNGIETGDGDVSRRVRIALAEIAAIKAISERKLVEHEMAVAQIADDIGNEYKPSWKSAGYFK